MMTESGIAMESGLAAKRILFLDDDPVRGGAFLGRHPQAVWVQTASDCILRLAEAWDEVHLDHDLGGEVFVDSSREDCGMEVVRWLCARPAEPPSETWFFVHSHNAEAAVVMVQNLRRHGYQAVYRPFGIDVLEWFSEELDAEEGDKGSGQGEAPTEPVEAAEVVGADPGPADDQAPLPSETPSSRFLLPDRLARLLRWLIPPRVKQ